MRNLAAFFAFAFIILSGAAARADRIHMPCDRPVAASVGTGIFTGNSDTDDFGDIEFMRIQPTFLRLELTLFSNCEARTDMDADLKPVGTHDRVTRWWLGSLSFYGSFTPETTQLAFRNEPKVIPELDENGDPVLDDMGNPVTTTENTLVRADLKAGTDFSGGFGARLSLIDAKHFHVEAYGEVAGSFGWNPAYANTIIAHALDLDIDVTKIAQDHAKLSYRWDMESAGLTIGFPLRPNTISRNRLTPFLSLGYTWFNAAVDLSLDEKVTDDLENLGVDVGKVTQRRSIHKSSLTALVGARLDFNKTFSLETSAVFAKTEHTTIYWFSGSAVFRFDYPWHW
ncbi:MAG TPA: autotransporter outer membrane beta-barrel domain-containing protein [Candidatus Baltobacteraceae bacterium]|nr:autotransporter outer membrane beta-barrel domain-containing protein [Candidatus Baltobacteraceae bacterium]